MKKAHQHFIPAVYLKNFAHSQNNQTYLVDTFNKETNTIIPNLSTKDVCVETDLYTLRELSGNDKYKIENYFSEKIENYYPRVYQLLVQDKKENITPRERILILYTTLSMYFRTPKSLNKFADFATKLINLTIAENDTETIDFLGVNINVKGKSFKQIKKEIKENHRVNYLKTQLSLLDEFIRFKLLDGLVVIELIGEQEFITTDNPVKIENVTNNHFNLFDVNNSIYIPLDSKHALFITPKSENTSINQVFYQREIFFQHVVLNHSLYKEAERWIVGTKTGIEKFLIDEEKYGKPTTENHPEVIEAKTQLILVQNILSFAEKGINNENEKLIGSLIELRKHPLYDKLIGLQDIYEEMKRIGLNIP